MSIASYFILIWFL